jgi:hypothetical protein
MFRDADGCLVYESWARKGVVRLRDLWFDDHWGEKEEVENYFGLRVKAVELWRLQRLLPENFQHVDDDVLPEDGALEKEMLRLTLIAGSPLDKVTNRDLTNKLRRDGFPPAMITWAKLGIQLTGKNWEGCWKPGVPPQWNEVFFKLLHRTLWVGEKARKWKWAGMPWDCLTCNEGETIEHAFWSCRRAATVIAEARLRWGWPATWEQLVTETYPKQPTRRIWKMRHRLILWAIWKDRAVCGLEGKMFHEEAAANRFKQLARDNKIN